MNSFFKEINQQPNESKSVRALRKAAIKWLLQIVGKNFSLDHIKTTASSTATKKPHKAWKSSDIKEMIEYAKMKSPKIALLVSILYQTGARIQDAAQLKYSDFSDTKLYTLKFKV